jgi:NADPH:quinone reductase-like Zn-dependent oxidoreductase
VPCLFPILFEQIVRDIDVVFDTVGGETLERSWSVLKPSGRMVTVAASSEGNADPPVKDAFFIVEPKQDQLVEIARLLDTGRLKTPINAVVPFALVPEAYAGEIQQKRGFGKVVVKIVEDGR